MNESGIDSKDLDRVLDLLKKFPSDIDRAMRTNITGGMGRIHTAISKYPEESEANREPGVNGYSWYERGFGTRTTTGRSYPTSERLGASWTKEAKKVAGGWVGTVGTDVSYAKPVQKKDEQAAIHAERNWPTDEDVLKENRSAVINDIQRGINMILQKFAGV